MLKVFRLVLAASLAPGALSAQTLAERISAVEDGTVRLSFAARPGVCGDGTQGFRMGRSNDEWQPDCRPRLVRVALGLREHQVRSVRTYVGGRWVSDTGAVDLGTVSPREAAPYFIRLAERTGDADVSGDPLLPSVLADSVTIWPSLVRVARLARVSQETRRQAVFWLGQAASAAAGQALDSIAGDDRGDRDVRKQAIFALSQRSSDEGVPALIRIARSNADPELRKTALFWLGQTQDPRALTLFEEILK
jgi:hypothetical protein